MFIRNLVMLSIMGAVPMGSLAAGADELPIEWQGRAASLPYTIGLEAPATQCELYIDEFGITTQSRYGASSKGFAVALKTRPGDDVHAVGLVAQFTESSVDHSGEADEVRFDGERRLGTVDEQLLIRPEDYIGRAFVDLAFSWNSYGTAVGTRVIKSLSFFVDLYQEGQFKRLWLQSRQASGSRDFVPADFATESNRYSSPVGWGYGTMEYLWRDGGSALFDARTECLR